MKKWYDDCTKEQRYNLAAYNWIKAVRDKSGRVRWYCRRRIGAEYAEMKLREYGLTVDEYLAFAERSDWE